MTTTTRPDGDAADKLNTPEEGSSYNLKALFRHVGGLGEYLGADTALEDRPEPDTPAELIDDDPAPIHEVSPVVADGYVDGIQSTLRVTYREHRPVMLQHVAAGCLDSSGRPLVVKEDLAVICAADEKPWVEASGSGVPVEVISAQHPTGLERVANDLMGGKRERLEKEVVHEMLSSGSNYIVVDGSVSGRAADPRTIGVVKTTRTRYLSDETVLFALQPGWRSPRFKLSGPGGSRFSAYVRMFDASYHPWDFGLIRVETNDPGLIDAAAALAYTQRQWRGAETRWDRQIAGVANVERVLRARRPTIFGG